MNNSIMLDGRAEPVLPTFCDRIAQYDLVGEKSLNCTGRWLI